MSPGDVIIHRVDLTAIAGEDLDASERERASRFHHEADRRRWAAARTALRRILGAQLGVAPCGVPIHLGPQGKPLLSHPHHHLHVILSHCGDLMLVALGSNGPIGIDVEPFARAADLAGCEETFCHPAEIDALPTSGPPRHTRLLELWTAKEAFLKAAGCGLLYPPQALQIGIRPGIILWEATEPIPGMNGAELHFLNHPATAAHCVVVCLPAGGKPVVRTEPV